MSCAYTLVVKISAKVFSHSRLNMNVSFLRSNVDRNTLFCAGYGSANATHNQGNNQFVISNSRVKQPYVIKLCWHILAKHYFHRKRLYNLYNSMYVNVCAYVATLKKILILKDYKNLLRSKRSKRVFSLIV